jgi:hypothetical protein
MMHFSIDSSFQQGLKRSSFMLAAVVALALAVDVYADDAPAKEDAKPDAEIKLSAAEGLPKPDELYAKYIEATGGEEAIRRHSSRKVGGRWLMPTMGIEGRFRMYTSAPTNMLMVLDAPGMGEIRTGYNGEVGWTAGDVTGTMLMEEKELADLKIDADFFYPLTYRKHFTELKTVEKKEFEGKECYHVRGTRRTGDEVSIHFDAESGLLIGSSGVRRSEHGAINIVSIFSNYEVIDGVNTPRLMRMNMPDLGIVQHFHMDEVSYGDVDPSVFETPASIQRLIDRRKEAAERDASDEGSDSEP